MKKLSEPMKDALVMIGNIYWLNEVRWDTYQALLRRGLIVRRPGAEEHIIGLTQNGMHEYWAILKE